jgi:UDPglucose 6-dehydrogenase
MIKVGIIGGGFVGSATALSASEKVEVIVYDIDKNKCKPETTTFRDILNTEAVFICVPTPMIASREEEYGKCDTSIVIKVIEQLRDAEYKGYIIIRSTVPVGFCESFKMKQLHFMPEFLTEHNWREDFLNCKLWILGISTYIELENEEREEIKRWFEIFIEKSSVKNKRHEFVTTKEGEMIKYFRNCFLAVKVSFCNEMYRFMEACGMEYETVRKLACEDQRIGHSHSIVPGLNNQFGYGLSCLSKDPQSIKYQMKDKNVRCEIINAAIKRNDEVDRPDKDWLKYTV